MPLLLLSRALKRFKVVPQLLIKNRALIFVKTSAYKGESVDERFSVKPNKGFRGNVFSLSLLRATCGSCYIAN